MSDSLNWAINSFSHFGKNIFGITLKLFCPYMERLLSYIISDRLAILVMHFHSNDSILYSKKKMGERIKFLKKHRNIIQLSEALNLLETGGDLPFGAVSIVVDDAMISFYETGWPLLKEAEIPFTLAVLPGLIKSDEPEHFVARLMRMAGHQYYLPREEMMKRVHDYIVHDLRVKADLPLSFNSIFENIRVLPKRDVLSLVKHMRAPDDSFMNWDQLRELRDSGNVNFASHSMSHPVMNLATGEWLKWELDRSLALMRQHLQVDVDTFVYPYGHIDCTSPSVTTALEAHGYRYALLTVPGTVGRQYNRYYLPRLDYETNFSFALHASPALATLFYGELRIGCKDN